MSVAPELLRKIVEAALMAAAKPLSISQLQELFDEEEKPTAEEFAAALEDIQTDTGDRGFELIEVASGWRFQVKQELSQWISKLWEEKPKKYSRAMLETLALVAYRQPITRGDIEQIRGVAVSSDIMKGLLERDWVKVVGHRDVPGRPAMYATTKDFLDYFNLKSLEELPTLAQIKDLDSLNTELNLEMNLPPIKASLELTDEQLSEESVNRFVQEEQEIPADENTESILSDNLEDGLKDDYNDDDAIEENTVSIDIGDDELLKEPAAPQQVDALEDTEEKTQIE